ncbi:MAG: hypothetical protein BEN19_03995 [Epulopiscium sp. Nuni2H_MBin003]|nr:MAG: hypothetical protein BEN19_03995 [Epulopiscium sp. Nuni2H_MBin003]
MGRVIKFSFQDELIGEYYQKKQELAKLKQEVKELSDTIKDTMHEYGIIYTSTENYDITIKSRNKVKPEFIEILEENNLSQYITQTCYVKDLDSASKLLDINPAEYKELDYHYLHVSEK